MPTLKEVPRKRGLDDFAAANEPHPGMPCWTCGIPEVNEINEGKRKGYALQTIRRYLIEECGHAADEVRIARLASHFYRGRHHERGR